MLRFSALVPDATINYIKNPALRYDTTDWNTFGSTITRSLEQARFGTASLKVVTTGAALRQGAFYRVSTLRGISEPITVSAYVRGTGRVRIRLINNPNGAEWASDSIQLETDRWYRLSVSGFSTGTDDLRLYVETDEKVATARTFYIDGAQLERKSYPTTYCDGDQPGCRWNGIYHNSASTRIDSTREGGRWVQLAGEERQAQDLYMTVVGGLGVASITNNTQSFALAPGGFHQNTRINQRVITLTFHAKHKINDEDEPVSLAYLHQLRQLLIDVVKPDRTAGAQDIWFEYDDGATPLYFQARYDGGLEGEWDIRNQFINSFPLRLLAVSPLMREDSQEVSSLDIQDNSTVSEVVGRINGLWDDLNQGVSDTVIGMTVGPRGEIYIVGAFTLDGQGAPLQRVAYYDGERWIALATAFTGSQIYDIVVSANSGFVYVIGEFTSIGGVAANNIAYWNGSAWNAMGTGLNNVGRAVRVAPNGDIYAGGQFTTAGGVSCVRIARWDGFQWRRVGQFGGLNNDVYSIEITPDGTTLYASGIFTDQNGFAANALLRVAQYNISTGLFSAMGSGLNSDVNVLKLTRSNILYAGGLFTASGSTTLNRVAMWNGFTWVAMGNGVDSTVKDIDELANGNLVIVGAFLNSGTLPATNIVFWNGSTMFNQDIKITLTVGNSVECCLVNPQTDDLYIGGDFIFTLSSAITTITNPGSAESTPVIYLKGPGRIQFIENQSAKKRIYLNLTLLTNEEVFIDPGAGKVTSVIRGNLIHTVVPGSDFRSFTLLPGENKLAVFVTNDVGALAQIGFTPIHWSADATQHGESL